MLNASAVRVPPDGEGLWLCFIVQYPCCGRWGAAPGYFKM